MFNSNKSMLSPEDFTWYLPSISQSFSEEGGVIPAAVIQSTTVPPHEPFHTLSTDPLQAPTALSNDDQRYDESEDIEMEEGENAQLQHQNPAGHQNLPKTVSRRSRYGNLSWDSHKEELKKLYREETLENTMRIMKERHSFPVSEKLYKEKFKAWGWQKNLPGQYAQWMTEKANKRKRDENKDTVFSYGGLQWDKSQAHKSAIRSKKVSLTREIIVETPSDIDYKTPRDDAVSPQNALSPRHPRNQLVARQVVIESDDSPSDSEEGAKELSLGWKGKSRSDLIAIFQAAQSQVGHADSETAETLFLDALKGYGALLGPTHEDTTKVAIAVANFYTEQRRFNDADKVVEHLCQDYMKKFGIEHRRTQQVILQVVELLNGCKREMDALAFLSRTKELAEAHTDEVSPRENKRSKTDRRDKASQRRAPVSYSKLLDAAKVLTASNDPDQFDYGIQVARTHVAAKDEAVEAFLKAIIDHCDRGGETFEIQNLRARIELLKLYIKLGKHTEHINTFSSAVGTANATIGHQKWEKQRFKSFETMEALLELVASVLEADFDYEAATVFRRIEQKADDDFGWDDERTIWAKISIGLIYQKHRDWERAKPWFDHAYAASFAANGDEDGITRSLQTAMDKRHFSYVSDEGRPFRTIFGVSGLSIRPNRLHLD